MFGFRLRKILTHTNYWWRIAAVFCFCFFLYSSYASAQLISTDTAVAPSHNKLIVVPFLSYSPETNFAFGAGGIYYLKPSLKYPETNPSLLSLIFVYSLEKQIQSELSGDWYIKNNRYRISFLASYYKFPQSFFGIGNYTLEEHEEDFTISHPYIRVNAQRELVKNISLGIKTFFEHTKISDIAENGILDTEEIPGKQGGFNTGAGLWFTYDNRDNIYYPIKGWFIDASTVFHTELLGSDYNYVDHTIEISRFIKSYGAQVLGFNLYGKFQPGNVPFNRMALLGGPDQMRGNYEGRFRDKYYLTFQTEYRLPIWRFIGSTFFGGVGEVANNFKAFTTDGLKYSYGGGLRLNILPGEKLNFRIDYGFGSDGDSGLYVQFNEAF